MSNELFRRGMTPRERALQSFQDFLELRDAQKHDPSLRFNQPGGWGRFKYAVAQLECIEAIVKRPSGLEASHPELWN